MNKNTKIALIDPPGFTSGLNSGIGYLCGMLRTKGMKADVIDFNNLSGDREARLARAAKADFVGISIKTFTLKPSIEIAKTIKKANPGAVIIVGGPHVTLDARKVIEENGCFDISIRKEGERAFLDIVSGKQLKKIKGIVYIKAGKIVDNGDGGWEENLDKLPFPDYSCFDSVKKTGMDAYPLVTSRGCPYNCTYCSVGNVCGKRWRFRSVRNIIDELSAARKRYGISEFKVLDDNFTLDISRAKNLCRALVKNKSAMKWSCPNGIRADRLDEELVSLMKKAGCYSISLGIEHLSEDVFDMINKGEKLDDIIRAVDIVKHNKIAVEAFFIIGLPGSTYAKDIEMIRKAKKLGLDAYSWNMFVPYPGTPAWNWVERNKGSGVRILRDWQDGFHIGVNPKPVFETDDYSADQRVHAYRKAYISTTKVKNIFKMVRVLIKSKLKQ